MAHDESIYRSEETPATNPTEETFDPYRKMDLFFEALAKWFRENVVILNDEASADENFMSWLMDMKPKERKETLHVIAMCSQTGAIGYFDGQRAKAVQDFLSRFAFAKASLDAFVEKHYDEAKTYLNIASFFTAVRNDLHNLFPPKIRIPYPDIKY